MSASLSRQGVLQLALLTVVWGLNWPIMKMGVNQMAPFTFRTVTLAGGLLTVLLIARVQGVRLTIDRADWPETFKLSLTNTVGWYALSIVGIAMLSSGRSAILAYTLPVWAALIGWLCHGERPGARLWVALAAAMFGVALLLLSELHSLSGNPGGTLVLLLAAAAWALGTHQLRRRQGAAPIVALTFWMMALALLACLALALLFERDQPLRWPDRAGIFAVLYNAVLAYGVAQILWFRLATLLPPVVAALSVMMIPVIGVLTGQWLLGEQPGLADFVALAAILVAIAATLLPARPRPAE